MNWLVSHMLHPSSRAGHGSGISLRAAGSLSSPGGSGGGGRNGRRYSLRGK